MLTRDHKIFDAVVGRGVHRTGTILGGNVLAKQDRHHARIERMLQQHAIERVAERVAEHACMLKTIALRGLVGQGAGDHQQDTPAIARGPFDQRVFELRAKRYRQALRQRPWRGGPDRHCDDGIARIHTELRGQCNGIDGVIGDIDGRRRLVGVFDLRLGQR